MSQNHTIWQPVPRARGWGRIYDNEPWHFEYSEAYQSAGCPARLPEPVPVDQRVMVMPLPTTVIPEAVTV